jgi:signal transduction histidine kinase
LNDQSDYEKAWQREKLARKRAEQIIELKNRDIYHLRQDLAEAKELLSNQEESLLQADKSVGQLASGITHEINNPLAYVTSNVNQLESYFHTLVAALEQQIEDSPVSPELARELKVLREDYPELFEEVGEGLQRIGKIVANVKRFARKNARERALSDINQEIRATLRLLEKQLNPNTRLETRLGDLPLVSCNAGEVGQVLINLILNADQALPRDGGEITMSASVEGKCIVLTVADSGKGIEADVIERIFDPFFTTKPVGEGTGLGLSVSYGIIEDHGGQISVASEPGKGTTFTVVLPID